MKRPLKVPAIVLAALAALFMGFGSMTVGTGVANAYPGCGVQDGWPGGGVGVGCNNDGWNGGWNAGWDNQWGNGCGNGCGGGFGYPDWWNRNHYVAVLSTWQQPGYELYNGSRGPVWVQCGAGILAEWQGTVYRVL